MSVLSVCAHVYAYIEYVRVWMSVGICECMGACVYMYVWLCLCMCVKYVCENMFRYKCVKCESALCKCICVFSVSVYVKVCVSVCLHMCVQFSQSPCSLLPRHSIVQSLQSCPSISAFWSGSLLWPPVLQGVQGKGVSGLPSLFLTPVP